MSKSPLRVVFFGTPIFAVPTIEALINDFSVVACVTQPDKPQGRKHRLTPSPVKQCAQKYGITVLQPETLSQKKEAGKAFFKEFSALDADIAVVVAYGKIIPEIFLQSVPYGFVNIHPSLLPQFRGATPIQAALLAGEKKTGVSIMLLDEGMDSGPILSQKEITLLGTETSAQLHTQLFDLGAIMAVDTIRQYVAGNSTPKPQNENGVSYCSRISKEDGKIDWSQKPEQIDRVVRAYTPWPGAYTFCDEKRLKILSTHVDNGKLIIDSIQPEGKKPMNYADFLKGYPDCVLPI